jgi:hypothetical protein
MIDLIPNIFTAISLSYYTANGLEQLCFTPKTTLCRNWCPQQLGKLLSFFFVPAKAVVVLHLKAIRENHLGLITCCILQNSLM